MSADDNFLARWSRRKQAVNGTDAVTPVESAEPVAPPLEAETDPAPPDEGKLEESPPTEVLPPLPRIDDLTATSDISGFLRKGVPEALKRAALRRAWSLDPAIRDYISPADYAWDFSNPGSIPGFGGGIGSAPLDMIVAHSTGGEPSPTLGEGPSRAGRHSPPPPPSAVSLPRVAGEEPAGGAAPEPAPLASSCDDPGLRARSGEDAVLVPIASASERNRSVPLSSDTSASPSPRGEGRPAAPRPPRHGGAMPR